MTFEEKRKEFLDYVCSRLSILEGKNTNANSEAFRAKYMDMDEKTFLREMRKFLKDENKNLTITIEPGRDNMPMEDIMKAARRCEVVLFDHIVYKHKGKNPNEPYVTRNKIMCGMINGRKVRQRGRKKNSTSISISKRDPRYNQVTGADKTARVTDMETRALEVQGAKFALKEFFGPRSDDSVSKDQMYQKIIETGSVSLSDLTIEKHNKQALVTASDYFTAAMIGNDLLTREYLLPRTLQRGKKDTTGLKREE